MTITDTGELTDRFRRYIADACQGSEYAAATGHIAGIVRSGKYGRYAGLTAAELVAEICAVLDALDAAQREEPVAPRPVRPPHEVSA